MTSYVWRKYADYIYTKWERMILWTMVEPYSRPKSFTPLVTIYVAAFYTGVVGSAITEQLYKLQGTSGIAERSATLSDLSTGLELEGAAALIPNFLHALLIGSIALVHFTRIEEQGWEDVLFFSSGLNRRFLVEKYWEDHPGQAVPLMKPKFYGGPWRVQQGEVPASQ